MLNTERLVLKPATLADAPALLEMNRDPEVIRYTGDNQILNIQDAEDQIRERLIPQFEKYRMTRFSVFLKDGTFIGWCGLKYFPESDGVDLGYRFKKKFWNQGYATEASQACLAYGFKTLGLKRILAKAMPENIASIKVMQKCHMTFRGIRKDPEDPHLLVLYDLTAEAFRP